MTLSVFHYFEYWRYILVLGYNSINNVQYLELLTLLGMLDQVTLHIEGFPALGAVVCFRVVVGLHVSSQVGSVSKLFSTMSTAIGLLSGVRSHMAL